MVSAALHPLPQKTGFMWRLTLPDLDLSLVQNTVDDLHIQVTHRSESLYANFPDEVQRQKTKVHQVIDDAAHRKRVC